jgi:hypothetical protein
MGSKLDAPMAMIRRLPFKISIERLFKPNSAAT